MRTFDPHFRHSFLHLKRIEEVTQRPKNGKKSLNMECFPDWLEIRINNALPTTTSFEYFFSSEKISRKHWWQRVWIFLNRTLFRTFSSHWRIEEVSILRNSFWHLYALLIFCTTMNIFLLQICLNFYIDQ